jgi:hypothetical protein
MGLGHSPSLVMDGLVFSIDAGNSRCYSGSGNTAFGLNNNITIALNNGVGFTSSNNGIFIFDGSDDFMSSASNAGISGTQSRTLCAWSKFNNITSSVVCGIGEADFYKLFEIHAYQNKITGHRYGAETIGPDISTGVWYFTAYSYDGTTSRLYLNSSLVASTVEALNTTNTTLTIGRKTYSANSNMNGNVPQVFLYNRALSAQEIKQNYNATKKRYGL